MPLRVGLPCAAILSLATVLRDGVRALARAKTLEEAKQHTRRILEQVDTPRRTLTDHETKLDSATRKAANVG